MYTNSLYSRIEICIKIVYMGQQLNFCAIVLFFIAPICVAWGVGCMSVECEMVINSNTLLNIVSIGRKYKGIDSLNSITNWQLMHTY